MASLWINFVENFRGVSVELLEDIGLWLLLKIVIFAPEHVNWNIVQVRWIVNLTCSILSVDEVHLSLDFGIRIGVCVFRIPTVHVEAIEQS